MTKRRATAESAKTHVSSELTSGIVEKPQPLRSKGLAKCISPLEEGLITEYNVRFPKPPKNHGSPFVRGPGKLGVETLARLIGSPPTVMGLGRFIRSDPDWRLKVFESAGRNGVSAVSRIEYIAHRFDMIDKMSDTSDLRKMHGAWKASRFLYQ